MVLASVMMCDGTYCSQPECEKSKVKMQPSKSQSDSIRRLISAVPKPPRTSSASPRSHPQRRSLPPPAGYFPGVSKALPNEMKTLL